MWAFHLELARSDLMSRLPCFTHVHIYTAGPFPPNDVIFLDPKSASATRHDCLSLRTDSPLTCYCLNWLFSSQLNCLTLYIFEAIFIFLPCFKISYLSLRWQLIITALLAGDCWLFIAHPAGFVFTLSSLSVLNMLRRGGEKKGVGMGGRKKCSFSYLGMSVTEGGFWCSLQAGNIICLMSRSYKEKGIKMDYINYFHTVRKTKIEAVNGSWSYADINPDYMRSWMKREGGIACATPVKARRYESFGKNLFPFGAIVYSRITIIISSPPAEASCSPWSLEL